MILEPVMMVEILSGDELVGNIVNDLTANRKAEILSMSKYDNKAILIAKVPLSQMVGYSSMLRSISKG